MSSQAIRNKINISIRRVITEVKKKALSEGKKKIMELKDELLSPDTIIKILTADINENSCSPAGRFKMEEKALQLTTQLINIENIANKSLNVFVNLEEKVGVISSKANFPNLPNPIEEIQEILEPIKKVTEILQYIITAAPAIFSSQVSAPVTGGPVSGALIINTQNNVNLAKAKIAEFANLFIALPGLLDNYIAQANIVFDNITKIKSQIEMIVNEIAKLKAFIIYIEMDFINKCNNLQLTENPPIPDPPLIVYPIPLTLAQVIADTEKLYGNILESLIAQGQTKAIRRVYRLGAQLQRTINTQVKVVNI